MSQTVSSISTRLNERIDGINNEEIFGIDYVRYDTGMIVDNQRVEVIIFEHDNGFVEFECNIFWSSPLTIYPEGKISWGSGPAVVAGSPNEISRVMGYIFEIAADYTKKNN